MFILVSDYALILSSPPAQSSAQYTDLEPPFRRRLTTSSSKDQHTPHGPNIPTPGGPRRKPSPTQPNDRNRGWTKPRTAPPKNLNPPTPGKEEKKEEGSANLRNDHHESDNRPRRPRYRRREAGTTHQVRLWPNRGKSTGTREHPASHGPALALDGAARVRASAGGAALDGKWKKKRLIFRDFNSIAFRERKLEIEPWSRPGARRSRAGASLCRRGGVGRKMEEETTDF
ncbi:zinc finger MYND domain-containing protein 15 [Striga asiatica]|uniref:Zinc finger MYND domain-containing protein 15 n=1 Tax=Striga asiatica TaxID=4170 RepID=A0A5A7NX24_STRAF|nr:zinc finger MYND domain-containing protein 15 [Striga asiatica]